MKVLSASDNDWPVIVSNIQKVHKVQKKCDHLSRVIGLEGVEAQTSRIFYLLVVQVVLLFGSETWYMSPWIRRTLGGFQNHVIRRLVGRQTRRQVGRICSYLPLATTMVEAGLEEVNTYVSQLHNTFAQFIETRLIMDICLVTERRPGVWVY